MGHNLSRESGRVEMMYVGQVPWHGLGTRLDGPATAEEAIAAAGLGWEVEPRPLYFQSPKDGVTWTEAERALAIVRKDTARALGVVGPAYRPIQNKEAFSFFDGIVGGGQALYHTAGALGRGERIWILAELPGKVRIEKDPGDEIEKYLLFTNSHDGTSACRMFYTPVRVVCQNTLNAALNGSALSGVAIRHVGDVMDKVRTAQEILGLATKHYETFEEKANWLSKIDMSGLLDQYLASVFPERDEMGAKAKENVLEIRRDVSMRFEKERGRSLWHAANAVVEYVDHGRTFRGTERREAIETRFNNILFGDGVTMKARAFELAETIAKTGAVA